VEIASEGAGGSGQFCQRGAGGKEKTRRWGGQNMEDLQKEKMSQARRWGYTRLTEEESRGDSSHFLTEVPQEGENS